eukprot:4983147-Prymnesium_polylepis.1
MDFRRASQARYRYSATTPRAARPGRLWPSRDTPTVRNAEQPSRDAGHILRPHDPDVKWLQASRVTPPRSRRPAGRRVADVVQP